MTNSLETHIAELKKVLEGKNGKYWAHGPAVKALIAALEAAAAAAAAVKPVKLPRSFYPGGDIKAPLVINEYQIIEALVAAGCKPVAVCPRCKRELDLTYKHDGAHYCHSAAGGTVEVLNND